MKNYLSILIAMVLIAGVSCEQQMDIEKEKEAILNVIQQTGNEFAANNMENVFDYHIQDETAARLAGSSLILGWDEISNLFEVYFKANSTDSSWQNPENFKENAVIKVNGNNAWIVCDNIWKWESNGKPNSFQNKEIAVLEKHDGQWKIAFNAFVENERKKIVGAWNLVEMKYVTNGELQYDYPNRNVSGTDMKIWTNSHFSFNGRFETDNECIDSYGGGTYTLNGTNYEENILYHVNESSVGQTIKMLLEVKNDTLVQIWPVDADGNIDENNYSVEKYVRLD